MCKVASVAKIHDKNRNLVWPFMRALGVVMTPGNNDGLGYASIDVNGKIAGERWLFNKHAFLDLSKNYAKLTAKLMNQIYGFFGQTVARDKASAIILHTRAATCGKGIENTHPFVDNEEDPNVAIIHNGVIQNHNLYTKKYGTCDSEVIAHMYHEEKVAENFKNLQQLFNKFRGWFTVCALSTLPSLNPKAPARPIMDLFTDGRRLNSFFVVELDTRVYSTSADDIKLVANAFGYTLKDGKAFDAYSAVRIDVLTGEVIDATKFDFKPATPLYWQDHGYAEEMGELIDWHKGRTDH